jgi:galactokinase
VPGRIEVAGKHTDYAGGRSLLVATRQGVALVATPRPDRTVVALDAANLASFEFSLDAPLAPLGHQEWRKYFATTARRLARNFPDLSHGAAISFLGNLPLAAGLSSSSTLVVGTYLALAALNELPTARGFRQAIPDLETLAGYLGAVENGYTFGSLDGDQGVGTFGGSEDHTAILCGQPGKVVQYRYAPVRFEGSIVLPEDLVFAIATSGIQAEKTGSAMHDYNRLSLQCQEIARLWSQSTGSKVSDLGTILTEAPDAAGRFAALVEEIEDAAFSIDQLQQRFAHFEQESEVIVPNAAAALAAGDLDRFGDWIDRSMYLAESLLGNQIPETTFLAARARQFGAVGASAFGAGFGGAVWALVPRGEAEQFKNHLKEAYFRAFPHRQGAATFFLTDAGPPAMEIAPKS